MKQLFKNAIIYRLVDESARLTNQELAHALENNQHRLPGSLDVQTYGFVAPYDAGLVESAMGVHMIAAKHSWRDLPSSVINEQVEEKAKAISEAESRTVGRKERGQLKDEVIFALLPKAFIKHRLIYAMIVGELLIVDAGSQKQADDFCSALREALGSLRCLPITTNNIPTQVMTHWLRDGISNEKLELGENCNLAGGKDGRVIRCKNQDLLADQIRSHIDSGMYVEKVGLKLNDEVAFDVDDSLAIKRIKFDDVFHEKIESEAGDAESKRELCIASMIIMSATFVDLINVLMGEFGGVDKS